MFLTLCQFKFCWYFWTFFRYAKTLSYWVYSFSFEFFSPWGFSQNVQCAIGHVIENRFHRRFDGGLRWTQVPWPNCDQIASATWWWRPKWLWEPNANQNGLPSRLMTIIWLPTKMKAAGPDGDLIKKLENIGLHWRLQPISGPYLKFKAGNWLSTLENMQLDTWSIKFH